MKPQVIKFGETIVKKRITHDNMSIRAKFPSGASLLYSISNYREKLEVAFSNDSKVLKEQTKIIADWLKAVGEETNADIFNRLENVCKSVVTGKEFINHITKK